MGIFGDRLSLSDFTIAGAAINVSGVALFIAGGFLLIFQIGFADMIRVIIFTCFKGFFALASARRTAFVINRFASAGSSSFKVLRLCIFDVVMSGKIAIFLMANITDCFLYTGSCAAGMFAKR